jgi:hypothetical protein
MQDRKQIISRQAGNQAQTTPERSPLPELAETVPILTPHSNWQVTAFINPDMTGENQSTSR